MEENKHLCLVIQRLLMDLMQYHQGGTSVSPQEPQHSWIWGLHNADMAAVTKTQIITHKSIQNHRKSSLEGQV